MSGGVSANFSRADWQWRSSPFGTWNPLINSALPYFSATVSLSHIACALVLNVFTLQLLCWFFRISSVFLLNQI